MERSNYQKAIQDPIFSIINEAARALGSNTYVIGGYVRDYLLQRGIPKDIDIVVVGSGIALARKVAASLPGNPKVTVFKNFGTAMIKQHDLELEFVGARKESYDRDSRKPVVEDGSLEEDQKRRDFTINALAISLNAENYGTTVGSFRWSGRS